ncbi:dATP/dGTP pyrophosphohydrolase domain-containing protein [Citrobacter freundii]|uniref:dATP/dGTP pyrophosphohydrolase domain-containing protein n=1 Tax=Citrobacter freundii TaxID=546 RepID=UPI0039789D28
MSNATSQLSTKPDVRSNPVATASHSFRTSHIWDAQCCMGISDDFITRAMIGKLAINKMRQWPETKGGKQGLHVKAVSGQDV